MDEHTSHELAYKKGYEKGKQDAMKWIPVTERLPEEDNRYATVCDFGNGVVSRGVLGFAKDFSKLVTYKTTAKDVWYEYDRDFGFVMIDYVTHWMPLPTLPKGE